MIVHPISGVHYDINSESGREILKIYLQNYSDGGARRYKAQRDNARKLRLYEAALRNRDKREELMMRNRTALPPLPPAYRVEGDTNIFKPEYLMDIIVAKIEQERYMEFNINELLKFFEKYVWNDGVKGPPSIPPHPAAAGDEEDHITVIEADIVLVKNDRPLDEFVDLWNDYVNSYNLEASEIPELADKLVRGYEQAYPLLDKNIVHYLYRNPDTQLLLAFYILTAYDNMNVFCSYKKYGRWLNGTRDPGIFLKIQTTGGGTVGNEAVYVRFESVLPDEIMSNMSLGLSEIESNFTTIIKYRKMVVAYKIGNSFIWKHPFFYSIEDYQLNEYTIKPDDWNDRVWVDGEFNNRSLLHEIIHDGSNYYLSQKSLSKDGSEHSLDEPFMIPKEQEDIILEPYTVNYHGKLFIGLDNIDLKYYRPTDTWDLRQPIVTKFFFLDSIDESDGDSMETQTEFIDDEIDPMEVDME